MSKLSRSFQTVAHSAIGCKQSIPTSSSNQPWRNLAAHHLCSTGADESLPSGLDQAAKYEHLAEVFPAAAACFSDGDQTLSHSGLGALL
jgi:hypothetical protein